MCTQVKMLLLQNQITEQLYQQPNYYSFSGKMSSFPHTLITFNQNILTLPILFCLPSF